MTDASAEPPDPEEPTDPPEPTEPPEPPEPTDQGEVTRLLGRIEGGDRDAESLLFDILYKDLRRLAAYFLRGEAPGTSLSPTALVNEAYLRIFQSASPSLRDRHHFLAISSRVMRNFLVDRARGRRTKKRSPLSPADWKKDLWSVDTDPALIMAIDQALTRLAAFAPRAARIVEMNYFGGLDYPEIAGILGVSTRTVRRDMDMALGWLGPELKSQ